MRFKNFGRGSDSITVAGTAFGGGVWHSFWLDLLAQCVTESFGRVPRASVW